MIYYRSGCGRNEPNGDASESRDDATDDELSHYAESHEQSPGEIFIPLLKHQSSQSWKISSETEKALLRNNNN